MFFKSLFSRFMVIGFCLAGSMFFVSNGQTLLLKRDDVTMNLKSLLKLIHDCYEKKANFGTTNYGELIRTKKILRGCFLSNINWLSLDIKTSLNLNDLLQSTDVENRELGLHINAVTIIDNEEPDHCSNFVFDMSDSTKVEFLSKCLSLAFDQNLNVRRAVYDFLCIYIPKHEELLRANKKAYSNIINAGLVDQDKFIRDCALSLKNNEIIRRDDSCDHCVVDTKAPQLLDLYGQAYLKKLANEAIAHVDNNDVSLKCKGLNTLRQLVENDTHYKKALQSINKCVPYIGDKNVFKAFVDLSKSLVDKNLGVEEIINIVGKINLIECNYDLSGKLLELGIKLAKFPSFFKPGLKLICLYNSVGGTFSYGYSFNRLIERFVKTCIKSNCNANELREFAEKSIQNYEYLASVHLGVAIYEELISRGIFQKECAAFIKHIRKISNDRLNGFLWSLYEELVLEDFAVDDAIEYANFLINRSEEEYLSEAASLFHALVSKGYARQDAIKCFDKMKKSDNKNLIDDCKYLEEALNKKLN